MTRALGVSFVLIVAWAARPSSVQVTAPAATASLVSTWTLTTFEQGVTGAPAVRVNNPRGVLIFDAAGHAS